MWLVPPVTGQGDHRLWLHAWIERHRVGPFAPPVNRTAQPRPLPCAQPHRASPKAASGVIRCASCPTRWRVYSARRAWDAAISRADPVRHTLGVVRCSWGAARCTLDAARCGFGGEVSCLWKLRVSFVDTQAPARSDIQGRDRFHPVRDQTLRCTVRRWGVLAILTRAVFSFLPASTFARLKD